MTLEDWQCGALFTRCADAREVACARPAGHEGSHHWELDAMTQEEVAAVLGVTKQRVQQIEQRALEKMARALRRAERPGER